jgi:hypothetical protein
MDATTTTALIMPFCCTFAQTKHGSARKDGKLADAKVGLIESSHCGCFLFVCMRLSYGATKPPCLYVFSQTERRLAQNREAARKSRLRKKVLYE